MIFEKAGIKGLKSDLAYLDSTSTKLGFVRWQWEYYRATYDLKLEHKPTNSDYFLRFNARAVEGKLESPFAVLELDDAYIGRATYPHGIEYESPVPDVILKIANDKLAELKKQLSE